MGEGHGYSWFTHGTIPGQELLREKLNLEGGDDRIQLAMDGLALEDKNSMTRHSCRHIPAKFGDRSLPYVRKAIEQAEGVELSGVVGCLAYLRTKKTTALLLDLYHSGDEKMRSAAEKVLIREPFRPEAKQAYFDMLKRQSRVNHATNASLEFGWKDTLPILEEIIAKPRHFNWYRKAIEARRLFEGNPIAQEIVDAEYDLRLTMRPNPDAETVAKIESARQILIRSQDSEAANLSALALTYFVTKGNSEPVRKVGLEILQSRPRQSTIAFLQALIKGIHENQRPELEAILLAVEGASDG